MIVLLVFILSFAMNVCVCFAFVLLAFTGFFYFHRFNLLYVFNLCFVIAAAGETNKK